jgi:hypothetical protein
MKVRYFDIDMFTVSGQYWTSFYMVTKTMMAVGYGDVWPTNTYERIYMIVTEILGAAVYGYILSGITKTLEGNIHKIDASRMKTLTDWCEYRNLDLLLRRRIKQHFIYMLHQTNG